MRVGRISANGCSLSFQIDGNDAGPALLLAHSLGATRAMWADQLPALAAEFRVIRYDARGHGHSEAPRGDYSIDQLGRDAVAVLDAAGAERAHVCGLSMGGVVGMWLGAHAADRVESLVLASTSARIGSAEMWNGRIRQVEEGGLDSIADGVMMRWFTERFRHERPDTVSTFRAMLASTPRDGYIGCCAALRDADLRPALAAIRAPTLVVSGADDPATPPSDGAAIHAGLAGSELVVLQASHLANVEQPGPFNHAVCAFLESARRRQRIGR